MRRLLLALAFTLASAVPGLAQTAYFNIGYDVASATTTYCTMDGQRGDPWAEPTKIAIPIDTVGSSTSVSAVTALTNPFASVAVGDAIFVRRGQVAGVVTDMVWVTARADADNITVSSAVDWSAGFVFEFLDLVCGTTANDGWIDITKYDTVSMTMEYEAGDLGGLDVIWQCKDNTYVSEAVQVYPGPSSDCGFGTLNTNVCTYVTVGDRQAIVISFNTFSFCRIGFAFRTSDGGTREDVHGIVAAK